MDYSSSSSYYEESEGYAPLALVVPVNIIICVVTVVGNIMVIAAYIRDDKIRQTVAYTIILNLSITDLCVGIFIFPLNTLWWIQDSWTLGKVACKLWLVIDYSVLMMSTFTIVFISLDRYWLLTKGLEYQRFQTFRQVVVILTVAWCSTIPLYLFISFVLPILNDDTLKFKDMDCELEVYDSRWFNLFEMIFQFIIPFSALVFLNYKVYSNIRERAKGMVSLKYDTSFSEVAGGNSDNGQITNEATSKLNVDKYAYANETIELKEKDRISSNSLSFTSLENDTVNGLTNGKDNNDPVKKEDDTLPPAIKTVSYSPVVTDVDDERKDKLKGNQGRTKAKMEPPVEKGRRQSQSRRDRNDFKRHRKAAITLAVLVGVFCVCWLPYYIYAIIVSFCKECESSRVLEIVSYFQWCNSTINPFIYGFTNILFRRNFVKFLRIERCLKQSHLTSGST